MGRVNEQLAWHEDWGEKEMAERSCMWAEANSKLSFHVTKQL